MLENSVNEDRVCFGVLGPIEARLGGRLIPLGAPQQRCVLAALLLEPNRLVPMSRLVDLVWGERPPRTAVKNVQGYVHRFRAVFAGIPGVAIRTRAPGYVLQIDRDQIDLHRFRRLVAEARAAGPEVAAGLLNQAVALWRGPALADAGSPDLRDIAAQLDTERLAALEKRWAAELELGHHADCVTELSAAVAGHPLHEGLRGLLMLALYRCGRPGDALCVYRTGYALLDAELGIRPGPGLRLLHQRILRNAPGLLGPARPPAPAELPHDVLGFAGRTEELAELGRLVELYRCPGNAAGVIAAIEGPRGIGKTALAVHWARRNLAHFPDGQLYLDLGGPEPDRPMADSVALAHILRSLGVPPGTLPSDVDDRVRCYRTLVAGRRMLVLLDNAASPGQVRRLLPGDPCCLTVVTSRHCLRELTATDGARRISLGPLTPADTRSLLTGILGTERMAAQSRAIDGLARSCGFLPLAIRIAAAQLPDT